LAQDAVSMPHRHRETPAPTFFAAARHPNVESPSQPGRTTQPGRTPQLGRSAAIQPLQRNSAPTRTMDQGQWQQALARKNIPHAGQARRIVAHPFQQAPRASNGRVSTEPLTTLPKAHAGSVGEYRNNRRTS
jgi:hypothetical protein